MKRIMLFGNGLDYHVGAHFRRALQVLDIDHLFIDENKYLEKFYNSKIKKIYYRLTKRPLAYGLCNKELIEQANRFKPDVFFVIKGALINPQTLKYIKEKVGSLNINFATDDPQNKITTTPDIIGGIPYYDLYACTKREIMSDVKHLGCPRVIFIPFSYDPSVHFPEIPTANLKFLPVTIPL